VTEETKNILLESAYFDPVLIRRASRKLGLSSDSSYRFERGVDYAMVAKGADRALSLILQSAKGTIVKRSDVVSARPKISRGQISLSMDQINSCLGASLTVTQCKNIFQKLGFETAPPKKNIFKIIAPSFRGDIKQEVDIIEEVSRIIGYDNLPSSLPSIMAPSIIVPARRGIRINIQELLLAQGFNEVVTYTMINRKMLEKTSQEDCKGIKIQNPLTLDQDIMRPSLLPSLLSIVHFNLNRGQKDIKFFETGRIYTSKGEVETLGIIMTGLAFEDWRRGKKEKLDYYDLKGTLEQVLERIGIKEVGFKINARMCLECGQRVSVLINGKEAGIMGKVDSEVLHRWNIKHADVFFAEINLEMVYNQKQEARRYSPIHEFPSVIRDISLAVKRDTSAADIHSAINRAARVEKQVVLTCVKFVEEYTGDKLPLDHRGMMFSLTYQSAQERTLRDEEVANIHDNIVQTLIDAFGVIRR